MRDCTELLPSTALTIWLNNLLNFENDKCGKLMKTYNYIAISEWFVGMPMRFMHFIRSRPQNDYYTGMCDSLDL